MILVGNAFSSFVSIQFSSFLERSIGQLFIGTFAEVEPETGWPWYVATLPPGCQLVIVDCYSL